jgi:hypothetical protein
MSLELQLWSEMWSTLALPLIVPLAIRAWFVADGSEEERSADFPDVTEAEKNPQIPQISSC